MATLTGDANRCYGRNANPILTDTKLRLCAKPASDGFAALQIAHLKYEHALEFAQEEDTLGAEAVVAVRREGREYAEAVTRYSNAAMAWLSFVDTGLEQAGRSTRKSTAGG